MSLSCALNWYHKKIGAYDKKLWEKSVDQRILRGVCAIPRKATRIKTELIDVDLVQGSAFAKAKPQDSWVVTTISGIKRILLLPFYFSWWQLQTNASLSCLFVLLYCLQIFAFYLYHSGEDKELSDVPVFEVITPIALMLILGVVHSQIVATFTSQKSRRKHITRTKRRRVKSKAVKKLFDYEQDKSSPDSASDYKPYIEKTPSSQTSQVTCESSCLLNKCNNADEDEAEQCCYRQTYKSGLQIRFSDLNHLDSDNENESNYLDPMSTFKNCDISENRNSEIVNGQKTNLNKSRNFSEESYNSQCSKDSAYIEHNCPSMESLECNSSNTSSFHTDTLSESAKGKTLRQISKDSVFQSSIDKDKENVSSGEDYFVAKKPFYTTEQWKNYIMEMKNCNNISKKSCSKMHLLKASSNLAYRRYSDLGPIQKKSKQALLALQEHHSADNIFTEKESPQKMSSLINSLETVKSQACMEEEIRKKKTKASLRNIRPLMELPINIKHYSSSCESGENSTSPNSPSKNQTSDLEWPLITNTDCNSDSTGCSSECSKEMSDVTPAENPFAWEILERSKKLTNKDSAGSGKISCAIWEGNECKKADLTALDISSAIIQKVDSAQHSTEYLYIGVFFAMILSFLPLMFRLKNGCFSKDIHDVTTDVFTLTVPSSEEVVRITDGLIELMWGKGLRVKTIISIIMLERLALSFAFFFLLSVAEKTFKQRFLYAKHFCYLTSSRGAKRSDLPHFRLNKVKNIKTWLSIRSYMKKLGPQRSVDVIVSFTFVLEVCVVSYLCIQLLKETGQFADQLHCWELTYWTVALGVYLLRFMIIGTKINKKYRNLSVLITEQINLYLHMEQKPHKKEELILANNVLKLAAELLKELESPFKISGICANSYLYNITKVVVLSAFSAMLSDILGFKLKLYKIKIR